MNYTLALHHHFAGSVGTAPCCSANFKHCSSVVKLRLNSWCWSLSIKTTSSSQQSVDGLVVACSSVALLAKALCFLLIFVILFSKRGENISPLPPSKKSFITPLFHDPAQGLFFY